MALWGKKKDPSKFHDKGVNAFENGQLELARRSFTAAIELEPTSERLYYRGVINDITGNQPQAIKDLRQATKLEDTNSQAWYSLSIIYAQQENIEGAFNSVKKAYSIDKDDFRVANHFATLMLNSPYPEHQDADQAVEISKHACELTNWEDPICVSTHQEALNAAGKTEAALKIRQPSQATAAAPAYSEVLPPEDHTFKIIAHFEKRFKQTANKNALQNIVPAAVPIAVQTIQSDGNGPSVIFTTGMSGASMTDFEEPNELSFAELMMIIPGDWIIGNEINDNIWPWHTLQQLGHRPHLNLTAYSRSAQIVTTHAEPEPFNDTTEFAAYLLLPNLRGYVDPYETSQGKTITFITAVPIYAEEYALGADELFERFRANKLKPHLVPGRKNLGLA